LKPLPARTATVTAILVTSYISKYAPLKENKYRQQKGIEQLPQPSRWRIFCNTCW